VTRSIAICLLAAAAVAAPATAFAQSAPATTLASYETRAQLAPRDGGTQIELAQAYLRAGRTADAAQAYRAALKLDNEMMETRTGDSIWSHQVATAALARTGAGAVAAR
jgi:cytochrome c-type biogenesis protein CcmH/NrfG